MKILLAYASKTGTTEKCAKLLASYLGEVHLVDLSKLTPNVESYDCVIVGGSIRAGMLHKAAKNYVKNNALALIKMPAAYFICTMAPSENAKEYVEKNIGAELLSAAICVDSFGGEMDMAKMKGLDRLVAKMANKAVDEGKSSIGIRTESIRAFAENVRIAIGE